MSRKRAAPDDGDAPAQPNRWRDELHARRTPKIGFLGLLPDDILRYIIILIHPDQIYRGGPFNGTLGPYALHPDTLRLWIDRWPAFDWDKMLQASADDGCTHMVRKLIPHARSQKKWPTLLRMAAQNGHADVVALILPLCQSTDAVNVVHFAIAYGRDAVVRVLLADARLAPADGMLEFWCCTAISRGHDDVLARLLCYASEDFIVDRWITLVIRATQSGRRAAAKLILADARVDPAASDNAAICNACARGHGGLVAMLLADGRADPVARGNYPITAARARGHDKIVALLLADRRVAAINRDYSALVQGIVTVGGLAWMGLCAWMAS